MRDYRVWDKTLKKMHNNFEPWFIHPETYSIDCGINIGDDITPERKIEEFEMLEFTGLKDKNGKKTYQGDIVKSYWREGRWVVVFIDGSFVISFAPTDMAQALINGEDIEIIGNIYENPELLEGKE